MGAMDKLPELLQVIHFEFVVVAEEDKELSFRFFEAPIPRIHNILSTEVAIIGKISNSGIRAVAEHVANIFRRGIIYDDDFKFTVTLRQNAFEALLEEALLIEGYSYAERYFLLPCTHSL